MKNIFTILSVCCLIFPLSFQALGKTVQTYLPVKNAADKRAKEVVKSVEAQIQLLVGELPMDSRLEIRYGAEDGPLFDPGSMIIEIPYEFVTEVLARFERDNYQETGVLPYEATQDALLHTLGHEYGHAFIFANQVIVLGREEDAVDTFATLLLLHTFENGTEIALSAADLFSLEDEEVQEFEDDQFWGEHSLDAQRYFSTLCLIYGSDPERYAGIIPKEQLYIQRDSYCEEEYFRQAENWERLKSRYRVSSLKR
ncbi:DUF4344 domain-containing metallopeptidase [Shewanella woodyi]|uniref:DUF4344 domain-containing metallopeptidase n=1 Tax=Shewanella woodyi TaxID=60961 RepID=UPI0007F967F5|nr:DUF4344 domain-containing metallopeptidase [Shewanella woodyi]